MITFEENGQKIQQWTVGASSFKACMTRGARLMSWEINFAGTKREVIHWPQNANWEQYRSIRGGNPVLFPFMGRNFADGKKFFWKNPADGLVRPMPMHGLAVDGEFEIVESSENHVKCKFLPNSSAQEAYPFNYDFFVSYRFEELAIHCEFELVNKGEVRIPWCAGHHFYFTLPWHKNLSRKDYLLKLDAKKYWHHASNGQLVKADEPQKPLSFGDPNICDLLYTKLKTNKVSFGPRNGEENIVITINEDEIPSPWTTLVTWSETEDAPYYCVEPWMGAPNSTEHGNGLHWVEPNQSEKFTVSIALE